MKCFATRRYYQFVLGIALLGLSGLLADAQNVVTNPGFETGNFTGWTTSPANLPGGSLLLTPGLPHSGLYYVVFQAPQPYDFIEQSLATASGTRYDLSFWLASQPGPATNEFRVLFGGATVLDIVNVGEFGYTQFTLNGLLATSNSTLLEIDAYNRSSFFRLDDVAVLPSAVPDGGASTILLLGLAAAGLCLVRSRWLVRAKVEMQR